ncbi:CDC27 family protein [Streptomyces sp. NPDC006458]|uniref:CDC27 family protein n=1 Tax=Streptomyces sp. NPDC006458 TaxID=3154302 RepID=UPI0033A31CCC
MEAYLDLTTDGPEDYEGRIVVCDGAEYVIGPWFAEGGERIVHPLTNRRSGLTMHLIKIIRDQERAEEVSARTARALAQLRDIDVPAVPEALTVRGHGGVFELEEAAHRLPSQHPELYERACTAVERRQWADAARMSRELIDVHPDDVSALHLLATCHRAQGDDEAALDLAARAISIEPNIRPCRHLFLECAARLGLIGVFMSAFAELKAKWPTDNRLDFLAAQVHLMLGDPQTASALRTPKTPAAFSEQVKQEADLQRRARSAQAAARTPVLTGRDGEAVDALREAYEIYGKDPEIAFNWGHLLLRRRRAREAYEVLAPLASVLPPALRRQCVGSMAFALLLDSEVKRAAGLVAVLASMLDTEANADTAPPLWALWTEQGSVYAQDSHQPELLLRQLVELLERQEPPDPIALTGARGVLARY